MIEAPNAFNTVYSLHRGGDVEPSEAWCRKLARVDVRDLGHGCVDAIQILSFHHQHRLGRVKVELEHTNEQNLNIPESNGVCRASVSVRT